MDNIINEFPNVLSITKRFYSNPGKPVKDVYKAKFNKKGERIVVKAGIQNVYAMIQSYADQVDINVLIAKYAAGDQQALNRREALYTDFTIMPENYFDAVNQINDEKIKFAKLPAAIKEKFDNDVDKYIGSIGTVEWFNKLTGKDTETKKDDLDDIDMNKVKLKEGEEEINE